MTVSYTAAMRLMMRNLFKCQTIGVVQYEVFLNANGKSEWVYIVAC